MRINNPDIHCGGCLCGAVRYEAAGKPQIVAHCHCEDCQRGSGAGHSTGAMFRVDNFRLNGRVAEYKHQSNHGNQVTRTFCPTCGSPIFGRNSGLPKYVTVSLGTLDDSSMFEPEVVVFARNKKPWDVMDDTLSTFEAQPDWKPDAGD